MAGPSSGVLSPDSTISYVLPGLVHMFESFQELRNDDQHMRCKIWKDCKKKKKKNLRDEPHRDASRFSSCSGRFVRFAIGPTVDICRCPPRSLTHSSRLVFPPPAPARKKKKKKKTGVFHSSSVREGERLDFKS